MRWTRPDAYTRPDLLHRECLKGSLRRRQTVGIEAVAVSVALALLATGLGCGSEQLSPLSNDGTPSIQEIKEELAMAGTLEKVDQGVFDWYADHPGEAAELWITLAVEYETETSPYPAEIDLLKEQQAAVSRPNREGPSSWSQADESEFHRLGKRLGALYGRMVEEAPELWERNKQKARWWLATNLPAEREPATRVAALYAKRMDIEVQIRDTKGCRFGAKLEWHQV